MQVDIVLVSYRIEKQVSIYRFLANSVLGSLNSFYALEAKLNIVFFFVQCAFSMLDTRCFNVPLPRVGEFMVSIAFTDLIDRM